MCTISILTAFIFLTKSAIDMTLFIKINWNYFNRNIFSRIILFSRRKGCLWVLWLWVWFWFLWFRFRFWRFFDTFFFFIKLIIRLTGNAFELIAILTARNGTTNDAFIILKNITFNKKFIITMINIFLSFWNSIIQNFYFYMKHFFYVSLINTYSNNY